MAKTDIWMPFYVSDYIADTMHLTPAEHGAYLMLILHYWRTGPIPNDDARLALITKLGDAWSIASSTIKAFFEQSNGMLVHRRIDREKLEAEGNKDRNQARAKAAADKRWGKHATSNANSNPQAIPNEYPSPSPSPSPSSLTLGESVAKAPRPAKKCPESFLITESMQTWAAKECPNADLNAETAKFRDHTFSTARTDWAGTWRNWLRKSQESKPFYGKPAGHVNKQEALEASNRAVVDRLLAKEAKYAQQ
jgi:uncharacterized protein YdaU (DUF1376 family)